MPQICDMGQMALLPFWRKACWGFFPPKKIWWLQLGANPWSWVPEASIQGLGYHSWYNDSLWAGQSGDRIPVGVRLPAPIQTGPGAYPTFYTMGTRSFPGVKQLGHGVDHQPPSSALVEGRVELYICSPSEPSWPVLGWSLYVMILVTFLPLMWLQFLDDLSLKRSRWHNEWQYHYYLDSWTEHLVFRCEMTNKCWRAL
jgi:hypothetical protein